MSSSPPAYALHKFFALKSKSNGKYLKIVTKKDSPQHGLLQFSEEKVISSFANFEKEGYNPDGSGELVHLRCRFNNKYWVVDQRSGYPISGGANEPEKDQSKVTCTLFKPEFLENNTLRLLHVHLKRYLCLSSQDADVLSVGFDTKKDDGKSDVFEAVDLTELVELPNRVVLKGDNGKYLIPHRENIYKESTIFWSQMPLLPPLSMPIDVPKSVEQLEMEAHLRSQGEFLKFSGDSQWDDAAVHEVVPNPDGTVRLRSETTGNFWGAWAPREESGITYIMSMLQRYNNPNDDVFAVVKVKDNIVALKNIGTGKFCRRIDHDNKKMVLAPTADKYTDEGVQLMVEEPVVERTIEGIISHDEEARVHSRSEQLHPIPIDTHENRNDTPEPCTFHKKVMNRESRTWTKTDSWKKMTKLDVGFDLSLELAKTPLKVNASSHLEEMMNEHHTVTWGETRTFEGEEELEVTVTVEPKTYATLYLKTKSEIRDVPFSYNVKDKLADGTTKTVQKNDGMKIIAIVQTVSEVKHGKLDSKEQ